MKETQRHCQLSITSWNVHSDCNNEPVDVEETADLLLSRSQLARHDGEYNSVIISTSLPSVVEFHDLLGTAVSI